MDTLYLKISLTAFAPEYNAVVEKLLDEKISGRSSLRAKSGEERTKWKKIRQKYREGPISQEDGAEIIAGLQEMIGVAEKAVNAETIGFYAVIRGAFMKTAELIQEDMDHRSLIPEEKPETPEGKNNESIPAAKERTEETENPTPVRKKRKGLKVTGIVIMAMWAMTMLALITGQIQPKDHPVLRTILVSALMIGPGAFLYFRNK